MNRSASVSVATLLAASLLVAPALRGQTRIVLHADRGRDTINRNIYGHFSEHLGRCIYDGFYVGEGNTKIPNTRGMRTDVVQALRKLRIPVLRWPGGCFADTYHWKDGVGPRASRPKIVNVWWGGTTEDNSFGTHEFLDLCEQLGTQPYITGNVGSGSPQEMTDWVQYACFAGMNPMAALRAQNGRKDPWKVRYWGVGNEAWGCGGNMTPEFYANLYKLHATFMAGGWSNERIFRIASGAAGQDYRWTEVLMRDIPRNLMEGLAVHHYAVIDWGAKGSATAFTESQYARSMREAWLMEALVEKHGAIMDRYDPEKRIAMVVDEWGGWYDVEPGTNPAFLYQQNSMRDAMIAGLTLNIFNNRCDRVRMANLAQTVNVLQSPVLTSGEKIVLTPTYHVLEMYTVHHDAVKLPVEAQSALYVVGKDTLKAVSVSASRDRDGLIHVSLVNIDPGGTQPVAINLSGAVFSSVAGRILASARMQDHNTFDAPTRVAPKEWNGARLDGQVLRAELPPCSVVVLTLK